MKPGNKKKNEKGDKPIKKVPAPQKSSSSFIRFVFTDRANLIFLFSGILIGVLYAVLLLQLFPKPSCYFDSGTYVQAARDNPAVSFRPLGYSDFLRFFHNITPSSTFLVMVQYGCNVIANLFLFFSLIYFFPISKWFRWALFILLAANPLYLLYSNYLLSEAFFCSLTVLWFTSLLWIIRSPNWFSFALQLFMLLLVFKLRYNAVLFPLFSTAAIVLSPQASWKKAIGIALSFIIIIATVRNISRKTEEATGTKVFSAFGGWQLATNALNVVEHTEMDTSSFSSFESKELYLRSRTYFDSIAKAKPDTGDTEIKINGSYLWDPNTPLRAYLPYYAQKKYITSYFKAWTALGPVFSDFGKDVIIHNPIQYTRYYLIPNSKDYWYPPLEAYEDYNNKKEVNDTIYRQYYHYANDSTNLSHVKIHNAVMHPWKYLFPVVNIAFLLLVLAYFAFGVFRKAGRFFTTSLLFLCAFYVYNYFFSVGLAPTVFRYHVWIITLCIAWVCLLAYYLLPSKKRERVIIG